MHAVQDHYADPILDSMDSREIIIDNRDNSNEHEDYQVELEIDKGHLFFAEQDSLRFVDENLKIIDQWDESFPDAQWLEVPKIPGSAMCTLHMLDGDSSAGSVSDGDKAFEFFDDFNKTVGFPRYWSKSSSNPLKDFGASQAWFGACYNDNDGKFYLFLQTDTGPPNSTIECWSFTKANAETPASWTNEGVIYTLSETWEGTWVEPHSVIFEKQAMADSRRDIEDPGGAPHSGSTRKWRLYYCANDSAYSTGFLLASETAMTSWSAYSGNPVYTHNGYTYPDPKVEIYDDEVWMVIGDYTGSTCTDAHLAHSENGIDTWTDESGIGCPWLMGQPIVVEDRLVIFKHTNSDTELHEGVTEDGATIHEASFNPVMTGSGAGTYDQRIEWLAVAHTKDYTSKVDGYYYLWYIGLGSDSSHHQMCLAKTPTIAQDGAFDTDKWETLTVSTLVSDGAVCLNDGGGGNNVGLYSKVYNHPATGVFIEWKGKVTNSTDSMRGIGSRGDNSYLYKGTGGFGYYAASKTLKVFDYAGSSATTAATIALDTWYRMRTELQPNKIKAIRLDDDISAEIANTLASHQIGVYAGYPMCIDFIAVRKYASPKPTAEIGAMI